ncbi:hypothetical protein DYD21_01695 [Rhodohalobacter sp. SW132]|nr:hypothetical protein DYD21_01695 [Rhodohalobacter sp. SW132]
MMIRHDLHHQPDLMEHFNVSGIEALVRQFVCKPRANRQSPNLALKPVQSGWLIIFRQQK